LSNECKRALAYAADQAAMVPGCQIGLEHLLRGLMREKRSLAMLREGGLRVEKMQERLIRIAEPPSQEKPTG
jgi:ATP-dependent Clp protease ATP-binding subunit ClpC